MKQKINQETFMNGATASDRYVPVSHPGTNYVVDVTTDTIVAEKATYELAFKAAQELNEQHLKSISRYPLNLAVCL